jgi:protocatechuate 3,4-dioxygenase beta subunit
MWIHIPQELILLSDVLVIDALNSPAVGNATESCVLQLGQSLTPRYVHSPTKRVNLNPVGEIGEYVYIEGRVLTSSGEPIPGAVFEMWEETDDKGERRSIFAWLVSADGS